MSHSHLLNGKKREDGSGTKTPDIGPLTLDQIARMAGTSKSTVSRVISHDPRISEKTKARVQHIIEQRHYRPNLFARALAGGKTGLIGVISSNIGSGFYAEVIRGIDLVFHRDNKRLLVSFAHFENDYEALWRDLALDGRVEGLVIIAPTAEFFSLSLPPSPIPSVICAGSPPPTSATWRTTDRVGMDNAAAMHGLVEHLVKQGCHRVLHAAGWNNNHDAVERRRAFIKACRDMAIEGSVEVFGITNTDGEHGMNRYLQEHRRMPDAIVAFNDALALGIRETWRKQSRDRHIPFLLSGWDDSPAAMAIGLSSVSIPFTQLGETAAQILNDRINQTMAPGKVVKSQIALSLQLRNSTLQPSTFF